MLLIAFFCLNTAIAKDENKKEVKENLMKIFKEMNDDLEKHREEMDRLYNMKCRRVGGNLVRCANIEVICYGVNSNNETLMVHDNTLKCKFL